MTVCIAALFNWNYGTLAEPKIGKALIALSDRMITAGDVEYEPQQLKTAQINPKCVVLIAGDYTVHSQALIATLRQVKFDPAVSPYNVAQIYGHALQQVRQKQAEDIYLAPLGLNAESFISQQKDMSPLFIEQITNQLQNFEGPDVEALVVGMDDNFARLYEVDKRGTVRCYDDIGFAAIGIGAWHAKSRLMQFGYINTLTLSPALAALYAAKKAAEVAPGIGTNTDITLITKDFISPLWTKTAEKLEELYKHYEEMQRTSNVELINQLEASLNDKDNQPAQSAEESISKKGFPFGGGDKSDKG